MPPSWGRWGFDELVNIKCLERCLECGKCYLSVCYYCWALPRCPVVRIPEKKTQSIEDPNIMANNILFVEEE